MEDQRVAGQEVAFVEHRRAAQRATVQEGEAWSAGVRGGALGDGASIPQEAVQVVGLVPQVIPWVEARAGPHVVGIVGARQAVERT